MEGRCYVLLKRLCLFLSMLLLSAYQLLYFSGFVELGELVMPFTACVVILLFCNSFDSLAVLLGYTGACVCFFSLVTPSANLFQCMIGVAVMYAIVMVRMFCYEKRLNCD